MAITLQQARAHNQREFKRLGALPGQINRGIRSLVEAQAATQVDDMRARFGGRPGLIARTGGFRSSFASSIQDEPGGPVARAFTAGTRARTRTLQPFSGVQEGVGGNDTEIRARLSQWLTVPLSPNNVGASGLPKYGSARDLRAAGLTRLRKTKAGNFLILVKEGSDWKPMWVLKKAVRVPARLRFFASFTARDSQRRRNLASRVLEIIKRN